MVKSRLEEIQKVIEGISERKYDEAMKEGQSLFLQKKYSEARKAFANALVHKPGDLQAFTHFNTIDSVWAKDYMDKGDEAYKAKKFVLAKANYKEAISIKPDFPFARNKFNQARKEADPLIYNMEKEKGNQAMKAYDLQAARRAYDSALLVKPGDRYIEGQLRKLVVEEKKVEQEEKQEAAYQTVLATAKSLADKASVAQEYELAIKEYQRASDMMPLRKFPKKKITYLKNLKKAV
jgi:tetratricopeptide (TPR) repeat protein